MGIRVRQELDQHSEKQSVPSTKSWIQHMKHWTGQFEFDRFICIKSKWWEKQQRRKGIYLFLRTSRRQSQRARTNVSIFPWAAKVCLSFFKTIPRPLDFKRFFVKNDWKITMLSLELWTNTMNQDRIPTKSNRWGTKNGIFFENT